MEARGGGNDGHRSHGDGNVHGQAEPGRSPRRPGKARVLTEADLDMELEMEARGGGNDGHRGHHSNGVGNVHG